MKWTVIILRTLMGLLFLFASVTWLFDLITPPEQTGVAKTFTDGLEASGYIMPVVKVLELLCGIAFVTGRFVPLASVLIAPIIVNIVGVGIFVEPVGLPMGIFVAVVNALVAWRNRDRYRPLFTP